MSQVNVGPVERPVTVPTRADGVELLGEMQGSGYRRPPALVRRSDGQVLQLTPLLYAVLSSVDGVRDNAEIAALASDLSNRQVSADNVARLVDERLRPLGLLRRADGSEPQLRKSNPLLGLRFRVVVSSPAATRRLAAPFAVLFQPLMVCVMLAAFVAVCWWIGWEKGLASATHQAFYKPGLLLLVFAISVVSAGFHELGHAAAARYGGATPGVMGMGLYLVWPAFYTDVTDSYRLSRAGRLRTDLGGLYFNAIVSVATFGVWLASSWDALLLIVVTQVLQMVRQLAPLVRFDGYHVLADLAGVPDLYHHLKPILLGLLPHNWGQPANKVLKPWVRALVTGWVLLVAPLMLGTLTLMVLAFPRLAATAWDSLGRRVDEVESTFARGDVLGMAAGLLSMLAISVPLFGMVYVVTRLVRRISATTWRTTEGRPVQRTVAVAVAIAIVSGTAWAWWPDGDKYRPVRSYERGTISDVLSPPTIRGGELVEGAIGRATAVLPDSEPVPTAEKPVLALVLVPRGASTDTGPTSSPTFAAKGSSGGTGGTGAAAGGGAQFGSGGGDTWVFPFNRPPVPLEGDTQAVAVNTTDGTVVYDIAFALVWVESGEPVDNVNSSYALASCTRCAAVAVAFQVVLVVGHNNAIAPQNLAAAVNYRCVDCVTYALAQQLVLTLDRAPSDQAIAELAALWREIAAFGRTLTELPLAEIRTRLSGYEQQIADILALERTVTADGGGPTVPSVTPTAGASPRDASSPTVGVTSDVGASPSRGPSTSGGSSPSGATSTAIDGSPSGQPSPSGGTGTAGDPSTQTDTHSDSPSESTPPSPTTEESGTEDPAATEEPQPSSSEEPEGSPSTTSGSASLSPSGTP